MNKTYLSIAGVAVVALVGFGILSQEQGDNANNLISNFGGDAQSITSGIASAVESTTTNLVDGAQDLASDATQATEEAYEAAVNEVLEATDAIEPAAGDAEALADDAMNAINN